MPETPECILCGRCLEVCPLFAATSREELSPRGKSFLISQALDKGALTDPDAARRLLGLCLGCGRCAGVCPQGRDLPRTLRGLKALQPGWQAWVWRAWIARARHVWPWLRIGARLLPGCPSPGSMIAGLKALGERAWAPALLRRVAGRAELPGPALLFPGCMARWARPWWIDAAAHVLGPSGGELDVFPDWKCCGFTLGQAGLSSARLDLCRTNIDLWRSQGRPLLLTICATCCTALLGYAEEEGLFFDETEQRRWGRSVRPLSGLLDPGDFTALGEAPVAYHRPCHAPCPDADAELLQRVLGSAFGTGSPNACCGMGGVMRLSAPDLSAQVSERYWEESAQRNVRRMVAGCSGCVVQLASSAPEDVIVTHWLDLFER